MAHQYYANDRPHVEVLPEAQAAAILTRRRDSLITDMMKVDSSKVVDKEHADKALRALVEELLRSVQDRNQVLQKGFVDFDSMGLRLEDAILNDEDKANDRLILMVSTYLVDRMCIPRDMGKLPAKCIRSIAKKYENIVQQHK